MNFRKVSLGLALMFAVACIVAPTFVHAMNDDATVARFHQPVAIPGVVLPAGSYLFKSTGPVVQVWDADGTTLYATLMTVPAYRRESIDNDEFEFEERAAGAPMAIQAWYFQGGTIGEEFVYPESVVAPEPPLPNTTFWADPSTRWWVQ